MKNGALQAKETRFELYKMVNGERQLQRNFGNYLVAASANTKVMSTEENVTNYEAGGYSVKSIIIKQNGSKEVFGLILIDNIESASLSFIFSRLMGDFIVPIAP